jgi:diguanylate cyclase (GGDEF)-like protein
MSHQITTRGDAVRHTAKRAGLAVGLTVIMTAAITVMDLGTDLNAPVATGYVMFTSIGAAAAISTLLAGILIYRSALLTQQLTLTRAELSRISETDQLTGLFNRRGFDAAAVTALKSAAGTKFPVAIFMCDIDHFKSINDRFGHEFGDRVLATVAGELRRFADRHGALVARHGGEEFAALMTGVSREQAAKYAEDIRQACAAMEIVTAEMSVQVTISIGFTVKQGEENLGRIMRIADQALYAAKHGGRDRVVRADEMSLAAA